MDFPTWFIMFIGWFLLTIVMGIISRFQITKNSPKINTLKTETKSRLVKSATLKNRIFIFYFWMLPLNLIIVPVLIYMYAPTEYLPHIIIILTLSYIGSVQLFWNNKYLIKMLVQDRKEIK